MSIQDRRNKYQSQFQPVLDRCKDTVIVYINALLTELFNNSDKALTSFAQKAETNEIQNRFFEAMAMIRNRHGLVEHEFRELLSEGFDKFWKDQPEIDSFSEEDTELELVDHESMDVSTALENMISRTVGHHRSQLYALGQRLSVVSGGRSVKHKQIPSGPHHLANAFSEAIDALGLEARIKVIILALFDKYVLKQLGSIYDDFNNSLKEAGVLPHLRPAIQKSPDAKGRTDAEDEDHSELQQEQTQEELGEELFGSILDMMASRRRTSPEKVAAKEAAAKAAGRQLGSAPPATQENLVSALSNIQPAQRSDMIPDVNAPGAAISNIEIDEQFLIRVKHTLAEERHKLYSEVGADRLEAADEDTIDLVGMLFEYMLNDPVLPAVAKALISHLHTPYLKVAIIDRKLLTDSNHEARQLLDSLVEAGSHWIDERNLKRGIYPDMQNVIDRVLKEFSDNVGLFTTLLEAFKKRMDEFRRKSDILEKRAQDSIKGREKLNIARQRASQEMRARSFSENLPQPAKDFLEKTWVDKLVFVLLRHPDGEMSDDWKEALRIADEIAWTFEPKDQSEREELERTLPDLRKSIEEGLASLGGFHQEKSQTLFGLLSNAETASIATEQAIKSVQTSETVVPITDKTVVDAEPSKPVTIESPKEEAEEEDIPEDEEAMMEKLRKIKFGTWFEIRDAQSGESQKVKLSWLSPLTASCMFVDRAGVQTAIKPLRTLAQEILKGESTILEDSSDPFVERTLHAIRRMLQRSLKTTDDIASELIEDDEENEGKEVR
ncbi:MAG: thymidine phosphorylase [gamma proteobacterium symbiont of Ctena orbiculata]|nr:MAG: thymidine phosphorylase [gamma proteobacterium symbiont of Ctena orbiculata]PVV20408.1 MAG: thymidine phosphorylase [gamma proteobacterium symbiont of Ctena orbiculata]